MSWILFAIAAYVFCGLEMGLRDAFELGNREIAPSFVFILVVFVALWSPTATAVGAAAALGAMLDLLFPINTEGGMPVTVFGPNVLGCMLAAYTAVTMRALLFRRNFLAVAFLSAVTMALAQLVVVALLSLRSAYDVVDFGPPASELGRRMACALYTGLAGLVIGPALGLVKPLFRFEDPQTRGFRVR